MTDDRKDNVVELDRLRANRMRQEKAAEHAISLHDGGKTFDDALEAAVKKAKLDNATFIRTKLLEHNLNRAVERAVKLLKEQPAADVQVIAKQAAGIYENVRWQAVRDRIEHENARTTVLSYLKIYGNSLIANIAEETGLPIASVKNAVDKKSIYWIKKQDSDWIIGTTPGAQEAPKEAVTAYLKKHGNSSIAAIALGTDLKEKQVKDQIDKVSIHWIEKKDDQWIVGIEKKNKNAAIEDKREVFQVDRARGHEATAHALKIVDQYPHLYTTDNRLYRLTTSRDYPRTIEVDASELSDMLTSVCLWKHLVPAKQGYPASYAGGPPPLNSINAVLARHEYNVPELLGISGMPVMTYDGINFHIHATHGFVKTEAFAGYYVHGKWSVPESRRTKHSKVAVLGDDNEAVKDAYDHLLEGLEGFRFEQPEIGKATVIAALLTALMRPCIHGPVPAFLIRAADGKAGKTLLNHFISIVATGQPIIGETIPTERNFSRGEDSPSETLDKEEFRKKLSADVLRRDLLVCYDNCDVEIGGSDLESLITATDKAGVRLMKTLLKAIVKWRSIFIFNGNNPTLSGAIPRRVLVIQLLNHDDVANRTFNWGADTEYLNRVHKERKRLIESLLVIVQSFFDSIAYGSDEHDVHGWPVTPGHWPTFSEWARYVPAIIQHAGGPNILSAESKARITDAEAVYDDAKIDLFEIMKLVERVMDVAKQKESAKLKLTKMRGTEIYGILVGDLIEHVCGILGATRTEYEEGYRVLMAKVPVREREAITRGYHTKLANRFRQYNQHRSRGLRFIVGNDRNASPVFAVVKE